MGLLLPEIDADARRFSNSDDHRLSTFAEIGVAEQHFVCTDASGQVANWCFADALAVDPDFRPGLGVDAQNTGWEIDLSRRCLAGRDVDRSSQVEPEGIVREFDLVIAGGQHQSIGFADANYFSTLTKLQGDR